MNFDETIDVIKNDVVCVEIILRHDGKYLVRLLDIDVSEVVGSRLYNNEDSARNFAESLVRS